MGFAGELKKFVDKAGLSTKIGDGTHINVDGWKYMGTSFGLIAIPNKPTPMHKPGQYVVSFYASRLHRKKNGETYTKDTLVFVGLLEHKEAVEYAKLNMKPTREEIRPFFSYECECILVRIGDEQKVIIERGTGLCSNMEDTKAGFEEYAISSTCETRSIGKAYRNLLGFVAKSAGYEPTPAEEMTPKMGEQQSVYVDATPADDGLPIMSDLEFEKVYDKVKSGAWDLSKVKMAYTLGSDQERALMSVANKSK